MKNKAAEIEPLLFSIDQVAASLNLSRASVYGACRRGEIKTIKFGSTLRIPREELDRIARDGLPLTSMPPARLKAINK